MSDLIKAIATLQAELEKSNISSLEFSVSASDYPKLRGFFLRQDEFYPRELGGKWPETYMILGVPFVGRPQTVREKTAAVCAAIAGGRFAPAKAEPHTYTVTWDSKSPKPIDFSKKPSSWSVV